MTTTETEIQEATIEAGKHALRQQYHEFCRSTARAMLEEAETDHGDLEAAREWLQERVHETADGCYWVIYTHAALDTIVASDNWLAIDDLGEMDAPDFTTLLTRAAYLAVDIEACADDFFQADEDEDADGEEGDGD